MAAKRYAPWATLVILLLATFFLRSPGYRLGLPKRRGNSGLRRLPGSVEKGESVKPARGKVNNRL
jgi:hypothetical protein